MNARRLSLNDDRQIGIAGVQDFNHVFRSLVLHSEQLIKQYDFRKLYTCFFSFQITEITFQEIC